MALTYTIKNQDAIHFITFTINQWVDIFTRSLYREILIDSLIFCQRNKGLKIYGWVLMTNHIHLIVRTEHFNLSDVIRDFKKFTATKIVAAISKNPQESRKHWLLWVTCQR